MNFAVAFHLNAARDTNCYVNSPEPVSGQVASCMQPELAAISPVYLNANCCDAYCRSSTSTQIS